MTTNTTPISDTEKEQNNTLVTDYLTLRKALGWLGILLPVALIIGSFLVSGGYIETSISNYFYTPMRDIFIIPLSAVALFLFTYRGYDVVDRVTTNLAGFFGLATALISTNFKYDIILHPFDTMSKTVDANGKHHHVTVSAPEEFVIIPHPHAEVFGGIHLGCAATFFLILAYISYFQFTKTSGAMTQNKKTRNTIYRTCAMVIVICILTLLPGFLSDSLNTWYNDHKMIFWAETLMLWAFGTSWLVKGEFLLKDK